MTSSDHPRDEHKLTAFKELPVIALLGTMADENPLLFSFLFHCIFSNINLVTSKLDVV